MLINCAVYEGGAKLADIPVADISDYVCRPGCFVWVAISDATPEQLDEMREEFGLHPLAVEEARIGHQRPKIEEYGDSLFAVLHLVEPAADEPSGLNVGEVDVFVGRNYVLSVRNRSRLGFLGVRERCERVFVAGLSMGGALALRLAAKHGDAVSGVVVVNPANRMHGVAQHALPVLRHLVPATKGIASDIAKPLSTELGYDRVPLHSAHSNHILRPPFRADPLDAARVAVTSSSWNLQLLP